jgi:NitT/TauT family transport system substrate-binding protein
VTHAPAIVGVEQDYFQKALGSQVKLELKTFNSGTEATEALFSGAIDATFIGPNPTVNAFAKSKGKALRVVAGSTSGGASLVVRPGITSVEQLRGAKLATPSLGNTQDVALRWYLRDHGLSADETGGGDVSIRPQSNGDTLNAFRQGQIDGAWVPEPWATRLRLEGGGTTLVNEADLWPNGKFVTTHLVVGTDYLAAHPANIRNLLGGLLDSLQFIAAQPDEARTVVNAGIKRVATQGLSDATIAGAWTNLSFTDDPLGSTLTKSAEHATSVGLLAAVDLAGIYDLSLLNEVRAQRGLAPVVAS